ncbi:hypothetical protein SLNWT_0946 [Streptomyces albus]|uniref:Uncharacterized protein n=1 Tax=Streptomyces albus (strain ATCC 21838 / DSM 41398 / FERM P-419 / JCM 4703 / NBRC 107858) TaxID=1081613 RepID=A0A0B5ETA1_STRA4|nr:hypothetical protein SLNWT_0946 [Streptomyces albus]AOU75637.1 hypothetical protein SLNHY_0946 [Streptomyces albus]
MGAGVACAVDHRVREDEEQEGRAFPGRGADRGRDASHRP